MSSLVLKYTLRQATINTIRMFVAISIKTILDEHACHIDSLARLAHTLTSALHDEYNGIIYER